jgi:para-aminobenzoate synthetase component 1
LNLPVMWMVAPSVLVVHDRQTGLTRLMLARRSNDPDGVPRRLEAFYRTARTASILGKEPAKTGFCISAKLTSNFAPAAYTAAVRQVVEYIAAGDIYQANLSQRFQTAYDGDGFVLFRRLFELNPAAFFAYLQAGDHQVVSTSPERFLLRNGAYVETRPIKGTRPRGATPAEDEQLREELTHSAKDDAELSMIVDLLRNDLGKVCRAGSVKVAQHKRLEAYQNVFHLVSVVEGQLEAPHTSIDLVRAAFPGGSITGCPKVRAMEIIDELESCRRHVYCGSIGYISFHDTLDLSIAIRTATLADATLRYSVGGGIVYDSDPQAEYEETLHKGRTLAAACQEKQSTAAGEQNMVWLNGHLLPASEAKVPADDQGLLFGHGFFETLRADDGALPLWPDHLRRFNTTWRALFPSHPPDLTWPAIIAQVLVANNLQKATAAVKILATRGRRSSPPWGHMLLVTARPYRHRLADTSLPGLRLGTYPHARQSPLAGHKTLNYLYYLNAGQWAAAQGFDEALVLNPDGSVSETNTANLLLIDGRQVVRPASAASLPGVAAAAVCRQLVAWDFNIISRPVFPAELHSAPILLATNALMGAVPVAAIDHRPRPAEDPLWRRINDALMPAWNLTDSNRGRPLIYK